MPFGAVDPNWINIVRCNSCYGIRDVYSQCPFCGTSASPRTGTYQSQVATYTAGPDVTPLNTVIRLSQCRHAVVWEYTCSHSELEIRCWKDELILVILCSGVERMVFNSSVWCPDIMMSCEDGGLDRLWSVRDTRHELVVDCKKLIMAVFECDLSRRHVT